MFTAPGPSLHGQGQVIDLTDSKTLLHLLSAMYPMDLIVPDTLEDALSCSACQKYRMDSPVTRIRALIRTYTLPLSTAENSFRAYGIASRYHLKEYTLYATQLTLGYSMEFNTLGEDLYQGLISFDCMGIAVPRSQTIDKPQANSHFLPRIAYRPSPKMATDRLAFQDAIKLHRKSG